MPPVLPSPTTSLSTPAIEPLTRIQSVERLSGPLTRKMSTASLVSNILILKDSSHGIEQSVSFRIPVPLLSLVCAEIHHSGVGAIAHNNEWTCWTRPSLSAFCCAAFVRIWYYTSPSPIHEAEPFILVSCRTARTVTKGRDAYLRNQSISRSASGVFKPVQV